VIFELPGVDPASLNLEVGERTLVVSGERARPKVDGYVYQQMEIEYGPFQRQVRLSEDVDASAASARYEQGMLTVRLPVAEHPPPGAGRWVIEVRRP
jgi:HSP20 family protein